MNNLYCIDQIAKALRTDYVPPQLVDLDVRLTSNKPSTASVEAHTNSQSVPGPS